MAEATVVMAHLNEEDESLRTVESMLETTPPGFLEIIAVDDGSSPKLSRHEDLARIPEVTAVRNDARAGLFASKELAVGMATTDRIIVIDAHMRFRPGWAEALVALSDANPTSVVGTRCLGLGWDGKTDESETDGTWSLDRPRGSYHCAKMMVRCLEPIAPRKREKKGRDFELRWMEPRWWSRQGDSPYEVPCVLGACYCMRRAWWDRIHGLRGLKGWGGQEAKLSLATWACGGTCVIDPRIDAGHLFKKKVNHPRPSAELVYNRLRIALLTLPLDIAFKIVHERTNGYGERKAGRMISSDMSDIMRERVELLDGVDSDANFWSFVSRFPPDAVGLTPFDLHAQGLEERMKGDSVTCLRCGRVHEKDWRGREFPPDWRCEECGFDRGTLRLAGKVENWANVTPGIAGANKAAVNAGGDKEKSDE